MWIECIGREGDLGYGGYPFDRLIKTRLRAVLVEVEKRLPTYSMRVWTMNKREVLERKRGWPSESKRKVVHILRELPC